MGELLWWHRAGERVVCVDATREPHPEECRSLLIRNRVYVVREAYVDPHFGAPYLRLVELRAPVKEWRLGMYEPGYLATSFRPARDTLIESLRALLSPAPDAAARPLQPEDA